MNWSGAWKWTAGLIAAVVAARTNLLQGVLSILSFSPWHPLPARVNDFETSGHGVQRPFVTCSLHDGISEPTTERK